MLLFTAAVFMIIIVPSFLSAQDDTEIFKKKVLVMHPFHELSVWDSNFSYAFHEVLNNREDIRISLFHEFSAADLADGFRTEAELAEELGELVDFIKPDAVVSLFSSMQNLMIDYKDIINSDVPNIFVPVTGQVMAKLESAPGFYAVESISAAAMSETLDIMKKLMPELSRVYVVSGISATDNGYRALFQSVTGTGPPDTEYIYLTGLSQKDLIFGLSSLPENSAIFYLTNNEDNAGDVSNMNILLPDMVKQASAPVFSFYDTVLSYGTVGGKMTSAEFYGVYTAELLLKLLTETGTEIEVNTERSMYMFNWPQLKRWGLDTDLLPEGSIITDREYTFWEQYKRQIIITVSIVIFQTLLIISLVYILNKKRAAEKMLQHRKTQLEESLDEKEILIKEIHHRVKNNLAIISSFLSLQSGNLDNDLSDMFITAENRVQSMALIHEQLYKSDKFGDINLKEYFNDLINNLVQSYKLSCVLDLKLNIQKLSLDLDKLIPIGIITNEIISNSMKHAFNCDKKPSLKVELKTTGHPDCILEITDNGPGFEQDLLEEKRDAIGIIIIKSLVEQLGGRMELTSSEGVNYKIFFPV